MTDQFKNIADINSVFILFFSIIFFDCNSTFHHYISNSEGIKRTLLLTGARHTKCQKMRTFLFINVQTVEL